MYVLERIQARDKEGNYLCVLMRFTGLVYFSHILKQWMQLGKYTQSGRKIISAGVKCPAQSFATSGFHSVVLDPECTTGYSKENVFLLHTNYIMERH